MNYSKAAKEVLKVLKKNGAPVKVYQYGQGITDPETGITTTPDPTVTSGYAALFDYIYRKFGETNQPGTQISSADKRLVMNSCCNLRISDIVEYLGERYSIVDIKEVNPAGTSVIYDLWVRK